MSTSGLLDRLANGGTVVVGEGYLFELERRGYLKAGAFVPEAVLDHPEVVKSVTRDFVHAGSDVALSMTYYGLREKLRLIGRENDLERLNRKALEIAAEVARETNTILAGNLCNTTVYAPNDGESIRKVESMFKEQIGWAIDAGVNYIVAETFDYLGEAILALECIQKYGKVPAVVTLTVPGNNLTSEGIPIIQACRSLEEKGAAVVGINCWRGPASILPIIKEIKQACKGPIACLPVNFRTSMEYCTMQSLINPYSGRQAFPNDLPAHVCSRTEIADFAKECRNIGIQYIGLCCGNTPHHLKEVAEAYGRQPPASRYSLDMSQHYVFGDKTKFREENTTTLKDVLTKKTNEF